MTINSLSFLLFFCGFVIVYFLPFMKRFQWVLLLAASVVFYALAGSNNFLYIILATIVTYIGTNLLDKKNKEQAEYITANKKVLPKAEIKAYKETMKQKKHTIQVWTIVAVLGILVIVKYGKFIAGNVDRLFPALNVSEYSIFHLLVPLGISYYTLMAIGYIIDVSKGKVESEKNILKVFLFLIYFPQITQGPIGRFIDMAPALYGSHEFSYERFRDGCQRLLWGFFKKMVIADNMKPMVDYIFEHADKGSGFTLFLGCMYFAIQLYADFSGYTDIVKGFSHILGIDLMENFERPFFSTSLAEYWRRWHISLSSWFRDYMFYPVSLSQPAVKINRLGKKFLPQRVSKLVPSLVAMFVVWFATGLWHDASWRYILWGVANGVIMISSMLLEPQFKWMKGKLHIKDENKFFRAFQMLRTFLIISMLKVFPQASSTKQSLIFVKKIICDFQVELTRKACVPEMTNCSLVVIAVSLLMFFYVSWHNEHGSMKERIDKRPFGVRWLIYLVLLLMIASFGVFGTEMTGGFEYAQY